MHQEHRALENSALAISCIDEKSHKGDDYDKTHY
jgi:hypothetical protein